MEFAIARMSTKGQIVIPSHMREDIEEGDTFLMVRDQGNFVLKNMKKIATELKEDLKGATRIEKIYREIDQGRFKQMGNKEFIKELESWGRDIRKRSKGNTKR